MNGGPAGSRRLAASRKLAASGGPAELAADQETAWKLPRLHELGTGFDDGGLGAPLDELARRQAAPDLAAAAF